MRRIMVLLWAVPLVAVAVAAGLLLVRTRRLEEACDELVASVRRIGEVRAPLQEVQRELGRSGPLADRVWAHWEPHDSDQPEPS